MLNEHRTEIPGQFPLTGAAGIAGFLILGITVILFAFWLLQRVQTENTVPVESEI
ncbi:LPXTG cell wall anchor domain-containing protein [Arcanobacterium hippocoleae]